MYCPRGVLGSTQPSTTLLDVSGMKEELDIQGNEYMYMLMCYTIAFAILQIPSNAIALKIRPRICIVMYAFRFMIGLFESGFSPIIIFLLGSWYNKAELAKRTAIWHITGFFGAATSGFLQAAVHKTVDGSLGLAGWRWMYVICGCMSLPVALSVWWLLPDLPHNTKAWYITEEDKQIALRRSATQGKVQVTGKLDMALAKRIFGSWRWWLLCATYILESLGIALPNVISFPAAPISLQWSPTLPGASYLPTPETVLGGWSARFFTILTAWPPSCTARMAAFFFTAGGYVTGVTWIQANEINTGKAQERALTISSTNDLFCATNSFPPILMTMAPKFQRGFPSVLSFALGACCLMYFRFSSASSVLIPTDAWNKASMFRTLWQLALVLTITIISALVVMPIASFVRDIRKYSDLEAPGVAFVLTPDHGTAAIFFGNRSPAAVARVEGTPAYKDFILRQNTSFAASDRSGDRQSPVFQLWGHNGGLRGQNKTTEEMDKAALEPVLRSLKVAVEAYLSNSICFAQVAVSVEETNHDYLSNIVTGVFQQIGLVEIWAWRPRTPALALFSKWLHEGDFGEPDSLLLVIDNSEYGFELALIYQEEGLVESLRRNYHPYTRIENPTDKASLLQHALEEIIKPPFDYDFYHRQVPQTINELVIYGDSIWDPDFRKTLDATIDTRLIRGAYQRQPVYAPAIGLAEMSFRFLNDASSEVGKTALLGCCWKSRGKGCPKDHGARIHACPA
ncbi:pantothenate transporter liz1 [Fusarium coicis]|nr:pantothenate transporter liz1 [Fusarium coicis]